MTVPGMARAAVVAAIAIFAATYAPGNPRPAPVKRVAFELDRPDFVKPAIGSRSPGVVDYPITMFDYTDRQHYITNGRSVSFQFPSRYYWTMLPHPDEAALLFSIGFDRQTGEPWSLVPGASKMSLAERAKREAEVGLSVLRDILRPTSEDLKAARARGVVEPETIEERFKSCIDVFHWIGGEYCGYEMFEQCGRGTAAVRAAQDSPLDKASIFARPDGAGGYDRIVVCNQTDRHGWCRTEAPHDVVKSVKVYFGGPALCEADGVVAQANALLRKHTVKRTAARPGWGVPYVGPR